MPPDSRPDPRRLARRIFAETVESLDAGAAVRRAVRTDGGRLKISEDEFDAGAPVYAVALGKAAGTMAAALDETLGAGLRGGVLSAPNLRSPLPPRWRVFEGGHPLPNEASLEAARASFELLRRADEEGALVVFLVSGGGSAMLEWPRAAGTTLTDLREANRVLVTCGASIAEVNAVRRAFSAVKGGGLSMAAPPAGQVTLIVSDTPAGQAHAVASGPTYPPDEGHATPGARAVVERYDLAGRLPASILAAVMRHSDTDDLREPEAASPGLEAAPAGRDASSSDRAPSNSDHASFNRASSSRAPFAAPRPVRKYHVLLDNARAVERAAGSARAHGLTVEVAEEIAEQHVAEGARLLVSRLIDLRARAGGGRGVCLISGGEFACPVVGAGRGGRNSETVLRCALEFEASGLAGTSPGGRGSPRVVALGAGTDGVDGNSPAAGALCDETTLARALALGLDPRRHLAASDSYAFFHALGDALVTGPTGTNVRDLRILIAT